LDNKVFDQLLQFEPLNVHNCIKITIMLHCTTSYPYWCTCFIHSFFDTLKVVNVCSLLDIDEFQIPRAQFKPMNAYLQNYVHMLVHIVIIWDTYCNWQCADFRNSRSLLKIL